MVRKERGGSVFQEAEEEKWKEERTLFLNWSCVSKNLPQYHHFGDIH